MFYVCTAFKWKNNLNFNKIFDRLIKIWLYFHLMQAYIKHKCFSPWSLWDFPSFPHFLYCESSFQRLWSSFWAIYWLRLSLSYWHHSEREGGGHMWLCWTYGCYTDTANHPRAGLLVLLWWFINVLVSSVTSCNSYVLCMYSIQMEK